MVHVYYKRMYMEQVGGYMRVRGCWVLVVWVVGLY